MIKYYLLIVFLVSEVGLFAQKWDYQWVFGYAAAKEKGYGLTLLDFNNSQVDVSYYQRSPSYDLDFGGSFIDSKEGELILHTNNCVIKDADGNVISGTGLITPTGDAVSGCEGNAAVSYAAEQSSVFIPDLKDDSVVYLIHKDSDLDFEADEIGGNNMYLSKIIKENDRYKYVSRKLISTWYQVDSRLTACPNKEKTGWWVLMPDNNSNVFRKYLITNDTLIKTDSQSIGRVLNSWDLGIGQAQFSPDGSMYAINSERYGVLLYDFNNETGELSNYREIDYFGYIAQGLCFSPNSRYIYLTTAENVYQVDLEEGNEVFHIGRYRSFDDIGWPVGLGYILAGPDCRLYVSPGSTTYYLHVILNPDEKGKDCNFVERAIRSPTRLAHDLPNLPQYRYLTGCDTTIAFPFGTSVIDEALEEIDFKIYPNPSTDYIELVLTKMDRWGNWQILDITGNVVLTGEYTDMQKIDVSGLENGMYILRVRDKEGIVSVAKFVKASF